MSNDRRQLFRRSLVFASLGFGATAMALAFFVLVLRTGMRAVEPAVALIVISSCFIAPLLHLRGISIGARGLSRIGEDNSGPVTAIALNSALFAVNIPVAAVALFVLAAG